MKEPQRHQEVQDVCSIGINLFRVLMIYLKPILPKTAQQVETFLNIPPLNGMIKSAISKSHYTRIQPLITVLTLNKLRL